MRLNAIAIAVSGAALAVAEKRGIAYIGIYEPVVHPADYNVLLQTASPLNWYYTWYPEPPPEFKFYGDRSATIEFVPTLKSLHNLTEPVLAALPNSSTHIFSFNEPDGEIETGGTAISPVDAARAYVDHVVPLRKRFNISHPAVTGSPRGMQWLRDFNTECWVKDPQNGCPTDFVVVHWYGNFQGMVDWMYQLKAWYEDPKEKAGLTGKMDMWVTEMGQPSGDNATNLAIMNQTMGFLDPLEFVTRYSWFGIFRPGNSNSWTGSGLSLFQDDGGLSELGAMYLGDGKGGGLKLGAKGVTYSAFNESKTAGAGAGNGTGAGGGGGGGQNGGGRVVIPIMGVGVWVLLGQLLWML